MDEAPFMLSDDPAEQEALHRQAFEQSPNGWIDAKLKGVTDWIRDVSQRRQRHTPEELKPSLGNPMSWANLSPFELLPTMAAEGGRTMNRWLYGVRDPSMIRKEDHLAPLGAAAAVAPFAAVPKGAVGMNALRRGVDPFEADWGPAPAKSELPAPAIKREEGEIFDYTTHDQMPPGNPLNLEPQPPYEGPRGPNERMSDMVSSPSVSRQVNSAVDRGLKEHPNTTLNWYNMLPLRERFHDLYKGADPDAAFLRFNQAVGATSPQSPVPENMAQGSWVYSLAEQGKRIPQSPNEKSIPFGRQPALGVRLALSRKKLGQDAGYNPKDSPKTEYFGRSLAGDDSVPVIDAHAMRTLSMATKDPRFLQNAIRYFDPETQSYRSYSPREMLESGEVSLKDALKEPTWWQSSARGAMYKPATIPFIRAADKFGISPGQAQAAAWYGNAEKTGVKTPPFTAMEILEQRIKANADARNKTPEQMLDDMINGRDFLLEVDPGLPLEALRAQDHLQSEQ